MRDLKEIARIPGAEPSPRELLRSNSSNLLRALLDAIRVCTSTLRFFKAPSYLLIQYEALLNFEGSFVFPSCRRNRFADALAGLGKSAPLRVHARQIRSGSYPPPGIISFEPNYVAP